MFHQIPHLAGLGSAGCARDLLPAAFATPGCTLANDFRFLGPEMRIAGNFRDIRLLSFVQSIEELAVPAIEFIERPGGNSDAVSERPINQVQGNPRLGLKRNIVRNEVFLRRNSSLAQSSGR